MADLFGALEAGDLAALRAAVKADPKAAKSPRAIVKAAGSGSRAAVELLHRSGADLNASFKNYRPLHALLQENPHEAAGKPSKERLACLEWLLEHGADPEQLGAWPAARTIIVAAFVGEPLYIEMLRKGGAKYDGFAASAAGDRKTAERTLRTRPQFATERDGGLLTALQCAAGSRLPGAKVLEVARLLIDAGAEVGAQTKSWGHDVDAPYFAASAKNYPMFELLLDAGADPTAALPAALWNGTLEMAALAVARGGQPDRALSAGKPLLNDLIRWGQFPQVFWLLEHGASPDVPDDRGWTATHQAASRGNLRVLQAVLDAGGDRTRRAKNGDTPRDVATKDQVAGMLRR